MPVNQVGCAGQTCGNGCGLVTWFGRDVQINGAGIRTSKLHWQAGCMRSHGRSSIYILCWWQDLPSDCLEAGDMQQSNIALFWHVLLWDLVPWQHLPPQLPPMHLSVLCSGNTCVRSRATPATPVLVYAALPCAGGLQHSLETGVLLADCYITTSAALGIAVACNGTTGGLRSCLQWQHLTVQLCVHALAASIYSQLCLALGGEASLPWKCTPLAVRGGVGAGGP